jgi:hypothetical protein
MVSQRLKGHASDIGSQSHDIRRVLFYVDHHVAVRSSRSSSKDFQEQIAFSWDTFGVLTPWSAIHLSGFWIEPCNGHWDLWFFTKFVHNIWHMMTQIPDRILWCYGEYQTLYGTVDGVDFQQGLPDETDHRVASLSTKKSYHRDISIDYKDYSSCRFGCRDTTDWIRVDRAYL